MLTLTGDRPASQGGIHAVEDARHGEVDAVHRAEHGVVQRIQADRHAPEARIGERAGQRTERGPVRRERQVERPAVRSPERGQRRDERGELAPDERLAARDPQLLDAQCHERASRALDLLEAQDLVLGQERVVATEHFLGHAIRAAEVAAIRDGDAQVVERPSERIERFHGHPSYSW